MRILKKVKVKVPILIVERRGSADPGPRTLGSQSAGDSMHGHGPGGRLPLLSARPTVTYPAVGRHRF